MKKQGSDSFVERKSRFIGSVAPVSTESQANDFIQKIKSEHFDATHNCWAYILRENIAQRYSDDGEPQGTAGIPILEILKKEEIFNVAIVVTRYYGGIQLGAGGLIRAYSQGAKIALDSGIRVTMAPCFKIEFKISYPLYELFLSRTESYEMSIINTDYGQEITIEIRVRTDYYEKLESLLTEISAGNIFPKIIGEEFAPI